MNKPKVENGDLLEMPNGLLYYIKDCGERYLLISLDGKASVGPVEGYARFKMYFLDQGAKIIKGGGR